MASAAIGAALFRPKARPTVAKSVMKGSAAKKAAKAVVPGPFSNTSLLRPKAKGIAGLKPGPFSVGNTNMLRPGYNAAGGMPNYGSNGLNVMKSDPRRAAAAAGMKPQMGDMAPESWLDENADFLTEAFNTLGGDYGGGSTTSGGGGGGGYSGGGGAGGGPRAGGAFAGGAGTNARKTWSFGDAANLQHRGI